MKFVNCNQRQKSSDRKSSKNQLVEIIPFYKPDTINSALTFQLLLDLLNKHHTFIYKSKPENTSTMAHLISAMAVTTNTGFF